MVEDGFLRNRKSMKILIFGVFWRYTSRWVICYEQVVGGSNPSQRATSNKSPINDLVVDWAFCFHREISSGTVLDAIQQTYNNERPNMALGGITPKQKLALVA